MSGQATIERASVRTMRRIFTSDIWAEDEVSTRNCKHCHTDDDCYLVHCERGNPLENERNQSYLYNYIVKYPQLIRPCMNCAQFESFKEDI